jgi:hypothetical protein
MEPTQFAAVGIAAQGLVVKLGIFFAQILKKNRKLI